ncbi:MAG: hypothetical protein ABSA83_22015 [Verrucomicrobiota bacterium]|jgi:predicted ATP-dependent endonuclease of OLD family
MPAPIIRTRFFLAVEGESEQSLVRWLQTLSEKELHIHLDVVPLGGGGFKSMLERAVRLHERHCRIGVYRDRFLLVDGDRAEQGDSIEKLKREAAKHGFTVCVQNPNHEGLLLRMMPGMEREIPDAASANARLRSRWANYEKPMNAHALGRQFSLDDLLRVASVDIDLATLLRKIGLMGGP